MPFEGFAWQIRNSVSEHQLQVLNSIGVCQDFRKVVFVRILNVNLLFLCIVDTMQIVGPKRLS